MGHSDNTAVKFAHREVRSQACGTFSCGADFISGLVPMVRWCTSEPRRAGRRLGLSCLGGTWTCDRCQHVGGVQMLGV